MAVKWPVVRLRELCDATRGITYGIVQPGSPQKDGVPIIRADDVDDGRISTSNLMRVAPDLEARYLRSRIRGGEVLLTLVGAYFGKSAVTGEEHVGFNTARAVGVIPVMQDADFVSYALRSPSCQSFINERANTTAQPTLNLGDVADIPIPWPSPDMRERATGILRTLDNKIEVCRRVNLTLGAMAQAIFKDWFVDFGPTQAKMEGRAPYLAPAIWELFPDCLNAEGKPEGWRYGEIGEIADVIDCLHSKKPERQTSGRAFLHLGNIRADGLLDTTDTYLISDEDYVLWTSRIEASPGDCVITNVGRVGAVSQIPNGTFAALGRNMTGLRCKKSFPFPTFLIEALLSEDMKTEISTKTDVGTILSALNVKSIPRLSVNLPDPSIAELFERHVRPIRERMEENLKEERTLIDTQTLLLPRIMSGQFRIGDATKIAEAVL